LELLDRCPLEYGAGFRGHRPPGSSTLGAYIWFFRRQLRFPQAWLLLPLGAGAIWLANVVRIFALVMVGTWISADVATGGFHSQAGWMAFIAVGLGLMLLAHRSPFFRRVDAPRTERTAGPSREAVYLAPLLAIVSVALISGAFSAGGLDRYYPVRRRYPRLVEQCDRFSQSTNSPDQTFLTEVMPGTGIFARQAPRSTPR